MTDQTAIQKRPETGMTRVKNYMLSAEVKQRFSDMMGRDGIFYLNQVMTAVAASDDLQKCEPASILIAAMRAASLKLSIDPSLGQAWIIPYKNYKHGNALEAQYQPGYKGIRELAMRTRLYVDLNVVDVYDTDVLEEDRMTGNLRFVLTEVSGNSIKFDPQRHGHANDKNIVGYMLYFKLTNGFTKTFYMSKNEIAEHAAHYAPGNYNNPKSKWNDPMERPTMERKTVLINGLRRYGVFNDNDKQTLEQIEEEQEWTDNEDIPLEGEVTPYVDPKTEQTTEQLLTGIGQPEQKPVKPAAKPAPVETAVAWPGDYGLTIPVMANMGDAEGEKDDNGMPYVEIDHKKLLFMASSMANIWHKGQKADGTKLTEEDYTKYSRKLSAIKTILTKGG